MSPLKQRFLFAFYEKETQKTALYMERGFLLVANT
jgi:hypothetical protein